MKKNKNKIIIIIIILLISAVGGYYIYEEYISDTFTSRRTKKSSNNEEEKDITELYKGIKKINKEKSEDELKIYKDNNNYLCLQYSSGYCDEVAFSIDTITHKAKILATYYDRYVLYFDEIIKLYDAKDNTKYEVGIENKYDSYELSTNSEGIIEGIIYATKDGYNFKDYGYYDLIEDKKNYENKYDSIYPLYGDYIIGYIEEDFDYRNYSYEEQEQFYKRYLINKKTGEEVLKIIGQCADFYTYTYDGGFYLAESYDCLGSEAATLYTSSAKKIKDNLNDNKFTILDDGTLYIYEDEKVIEYDDNGKKEDSYNIKYDGDFYKIIRDFALVTNNGKLILINFKTNKKIELCDWHSKYSVHTMLSGYYKENALQNENEKKEGIYIIVGKGYGSNAYGEEGMEFYIDPETYKVTKYNLDMIGGYAKPVLYLYPEKDVNVKVNFEHEEELTTTYPKFKDEWKVLAKPNGDLYDEDGKYYYGLYWEEKGNHKVNFDTGFYVNKDNAIEFLEDKLSLIGLSDRERNEFIMYWLPILEQNGQSAVYFELTEERDSYNKLEISPAPDSILRVAMHVKKVDKLIKIKEQELTKFERKGFVAVEWGGVLYK